MATLLMKCQSLRQYGDLVVPAFGKILPQETKTLDFYGIQFQDYIIDDLARLVSETKIKVWLGTELLSSTEVSALKYRDVSETLQPRETQASDYINGGITFTFTNTYDVAPRVSVTPVLKNLVAPLMVEAHVTAVSKTTCTVIANKVTLAGLLATFDECATNDVTIHMFAEEA